MNVADAQKKLAKALKRLQPEQGKVARRNARANALYALRVLKTAMNEEFPAIRDGVKRGRLSAQQRLNRLKAQGYEPTGSDPRLLQELLVAKVTVKRSDDGRIWVPSWAKAVPINSEFASEWLARGRKPADRISVMAEILAWKAWRDRGSIPGVLPATVVNRVRRDKAFRDAVIVAGEIDMAHVRKFLEDQYMKEAA